METETGTDASTAESQIDEDKLKALTQRVWGYRQGQLVALMMHLGRRLGLYEALAPLGRTTASEVAGVTGLHERWVREWLLSQAAADLIESEDGVHFEMTAEGVAVLADSSSLTFAGNAMSGPRSLETVDRIAESFRTGIGLSYDDLGAGEAVSIEQAFGNWTAHVLVPHFVPAVDGLAAKLEAGARVADVGCGAGFALRLLEEAYPNGTYHGYDPSEHAIALARQRAEESGSTVEFFTEPSSAMEGDYDVVLTLDCLHDMTRPAETAEDIRGHLADDGVWLIKEIRSHHEYAKNKRNPMLAMMYSTSVSVCMSSAMSEEGGAGYGTIGLNPQALGELVKGAGFNSIQSHEFEDPINLYYEVRP